MGLLGVMVGLRRAGIVWSAPYALLGVGVWLATQASGVHATIAGVVLGLLTPARALTPGAVAREWAADLADDPSPGELDAMTRLARTSVSPAERLEHLLHPWTSFLVVPLFALANAGVIIKADSFDTPGVLRVTVGVVLGLVVGKVVGITAAAWLAVRAGVGRLPEGATWAMLVGIASVAGIGFTVSLFIAELAFEGGALQDAAKIGVLGASTLAAIVGSGVLIRACREHET
jgi:NhaA family Na+:H+ antiporter